MKNTILFPNLNARFKYEADLGVIDVLPLTVNLRLAEAAAKFVGGITTLLAIEAYSNTLNVNTGKL